MAGTGSTESEGPKRPGRQGTGELRRAQEPQEITQDAFKQAVFKYGRRFNRDARPFSVLSIRVTTQGTLHSLVPHLIKSLRSMDKLCRVHCDLYLILLPDTDETVAGLVAERLRGQLSQFKLPRRTLSEGLLPRILVSGTDSSADDNMRILERIGLGIDERGELVVGTEDLDAAFVPDSDGSYAAWATRYIAVSVPDNVQSEACTFGQIVRARVYDTWENSVCREVLTATPLPGLVVNHSELRARARHLQFAIGPGATRLIDFYIEPHGTVHLIVESLPRAISAQQESDFQARSAAAAKALGAVSDVDSLTPPLELLVQLLAVVSCLQSMIPPIVPGRLQVEDIAVDPAGKIILTGFHLNYVLFGPVPHHELLEELAALIEKVCQAFAADGNKEVVSLCRLLRTRPVSDAVSSVHKVRLLVRRMLERLDSQTPIAKPDAIVPMPEVDNA